MNHIEYQEEISDLADIIIDEAIAELEPDELSVEEVQEKISDSLLHETIDGHQWIIYTHNHADIIRHSDNDEAYEDMYCNDDLGDLVKSHGLDHITMIIAFWAFYYDVQEVIDNARIIERMLEPEEEDCQRVVDDYPEEANHAKLGNPRALMYLVGRYVSRTRGLGNAARARTIIQEMVQE
jgi:hypothetical protein